jgi:hypothetical protein
MANMPSNWLTYFDVANAGATISKVQSLGGRVMMPAMTMGKVRTFAVLADPQGAVFAIVQTLGGKEEGEPKPAARAVKATPKADAKPMAKPAPMKMKAKPAPAKKAAARPKSKAKTAPKRTAKASKARPKPKAKAGKATPKRKAKAGAKR